MKRNYTGRVGSKGLRGVGSKGLRGVGSRGLRELGTSDFKKYILFTPCFLSGTLDNGEKLLTNQLSKCRLLQMKKISPDISVLKIGPYAWHLCCGHLNI